MGHAHDMVLWHKCGQRFWVHDSGTGRVTYTVAGAGLVRACPTCQAKLPSGWPDLYPGSGWSDKPLATKTAVAAQGLSS